MKLLRFLLCAAWVFGLAQQARAQSPSATPPAARGEQPAAAKSSDDKALVYVLRYREMNGALVKRSVYCDEVELAKIQNGRYFLAKLDPGQHVLRSTEKESGVVMNLEAGKKYYLRVEIVYGGGGRMSLVAPEQGLFEVKKLKPIDADKVVNKQLVVPPDQTEP